VTLEGVPEILAGILRDNFASSFAELEENIAIGVRAVAAVMGEIRFGLFDLASDLKVFASELTRLGVEAAAGQEAIINEFRSGLASLVGIDLFPQLVDVKTALADLTAALATMGLTIEQQDALLADAEKAMKLYNKQLKSDVLGQLADMAREFGVQAEFVQRVQRIQVKIEFAILKAQLISLELWERFSDVFKELRKLALNAANEIGNAAGAAGGGAAGTPTNVRVVASVPIDVEPKSGSSWFKDVFKPQAAALGEMFSQGLSPLEQILKEFEELDPSRGGQILALAVENAKKAFANLIAGLKTAIREFRDSLDFGPFAQSTPNDQAQAAFANFQDLLAAVMGGDVDAMGELIAAAQQTLSLSADAYGNVSDIFIGIRDAILAGLDQVLAAGFDLDPVTGDVLVEGAITTNTNVLAAGFDQTVTELGAVNMELRRQSTLLESVLRSMGRGFSLPRRQPAF